MTPLLLACLLSHNSFAVREQANRSLDRMGLESLPALEWGMLQADPEMVCRCEASKVRMEATLLAWTAELERHKRDGFIAECLLLPYVDAIPGGISWRYEAVRLGFPQSDRRGFVADKVGTALMIRDMCHWDGAQELFRWLPVMVIRSAHWDAHRSWGS